MKSVNLDQSTARRIRIAIFSFYFLQGICFASWASRIPDIKNLLGLDDAAWGTMLLMIPIGQITGMTFSGPLISRLGSKKVLLAAIVGYALTLVGIALSTSQYTLLIILIVFGFFGNFCNIAVNTQGVTLENFYSRPIMATFHGGWSFAGLLGGAIGLLMTTLGVNPLLHFVTIAILTLAGTVMNFQYLQPDIKVAPIVSEKGTQKNKPELFLLLLGIVGFFGMAAEGAMTDWNGLYLQDVVNIETHLAPLGLIAYMATMATGRFVMDKVTQKWGRKRVLQFSGLSIFLGLFMTVAFPNFIVAIVAFMIVGFGTCGVVPTLYSTAGQKTKIPTGMALTIVSSISFLGFLLGPPIIGYISNVTNLRYSYALIGIFGVCIMIMSSRLKVLKK